MSDTLFYILMYFLTFSQIIWLLKARKRQKFTMKFSRLEKDISKYLIENSKTLSLNDKQEIFQLFDILSLIDRVYSQNWQYKFFNFYKFVKFSKQAKDFDNKSAKIDPKNPKIKEFQDRLRKHILESFFAYTPFLLQEIALHSSLNFFKESKDTIIKLRKSYENMRYI